MSHSPIAPVKPGLHSYNLNRRLSPERRQLPLLRYLRVFLAATGISALGYYGYSLADEHVYQAYENWSFDRHLSGHRATFEDWLRERTPAGTFMKPVDTAAETPGKATPTISPRLSGLPAPQEGALLGRVAINRLNLSAIVRQGVDEDTLRRAVGHVPSTALPGQDGNFAIAAHRDTLFRALKDIKQGDNVMFQSTAGNYKYEVVSTQIVVPSNVSVLKPPAEGGWLTMITCYPFYYVGSAPKRFIVQAKLVSAEASSLVDDGANTEAAHPAQLSSPPLTKAPVKRHRTVRQASMKRPRPARESASLRQVADRPDPFVVRSAELKKKQGFWRGLFHRHSN